MTLNGFRRWLESVSFDENGDTMGMIDETVRTIHEAQRIAVELHLPRALRKSVLRSRRRF